MVAWLTMPSLRSALSQLRTGKGKKDRIVPIPTRAGLALDAYLRDARPALVKDRTCALFTSWLGKRLKPVTLCARSVRTGVSGLAPAPAAAPWFRFG